MVVDKVAMDMQLLVFPPPAYASPSFVWGAKYRHSQGRYLFLNSQLKGRESGWPRETSKLPRSCCKGNPLPIGHPPGEGVDKEADAQFYALTLLCMGVGERPFRDRWTMIPSVERSKGYNYKREGPLSVPTPLSH